MQNQPKHLDTLILGCFIAVITFQPFLYHGEIIFLETGIHLPAINALFQNAVPYKDFFYLRGPFELYIPYFMMLVLGKNAAVLPLFYYLGTILTLLIYLSIAKYLYRTRLVLYLMIPVLVAKTFPYVAFRYWGGMRYAICAFGLLCILFFFKTGKRRFIFLGGIVSAVCFLTTIEAGVSSIIAVIGALIFSWIFKIQERKFTIHSVFVYFGGILIVLIPFFIYLAKAGALMPFLEAQVTIAANLTKTFVESSSSGPQSLGEFFVGLWPGSRHFKVMTPAYCYLFFAGYMIWRIRKKDVDWKLGAVMNIAIYGLILYFASFRKIEFKHFEMALQPSKVLLFFMLEPVYLYLVQFKDKLKSGGPGKMALAKEYFIYFLITGFIMSSLGYSVARYSRRFIAFKLFKARLLGRDTSHLPPTHGEKYRMINIDRARGMEVPVWQADEIEGAVACIQKRTAKDEALFAYPELGSFNFLADRPFVGKFPMASFAWFHEKWREENFAELMRVKPKLVVMGKLDEKDTAPDWYFRNPKNKEYFDQITSWILRNYTLKRDYKTISVYERKGIK